MKEIEGGATSTGSGPTEAGGVVQEPPGGEIPAGDATAAEAKGKQVGVEIATTSEAVASLLAAGRPFVKKADPASADPYLGFDISGYPGDAAMSAWWANSPLFFTGFYLAPAPNHSDTSWMSKRSYLAGLGWGFAVVYVGRQAGQSNLTYAQGQADADNAATLAGNAGFPSLATIFLDIETGGTLPNNLISYIQGWVAEIDGVSAYWAGVYCSYTSAAQIKTALGSDHITFWCWHVDCPPSPGCTLPSTPPSPSSCGYSGASVWQYAQSPEPGGISCSGYSGGQCSKTYGGYTLHVDLDTASSTNPSNG